MSEDVVYFVHISDTHIGPSTDFSVHDHNPYYCAQSLVDVINHLPQKPHFVIHTGDVVYDPDPSAYALAASTFAKLEVPIYYVNGNHDSANAIKRHMKMGPRTILGDDDRLSYAFEFSGFRFLVLDAKGPPEIDPQGLLPDSQLDLLARESQAEGPPLIVFIHFPILPMNSIWMDNNMLIQNGPTVHRTLYIARNRIRAVFFGHVHQHMQMLKDGILYASVASTFSQFGAWPEDLDTHHDLDQDPGYSFVHLLPDQTLIHQHTFPRPEAV